MKHHHYIVDGVLLRVTAASRPNAKNRRPFVVRERRGEGEWYTPSFPEIPVGRLLRGEYLGSCPVEPARSSGSAPVVDLMAALKESLAAGRSSGDGSEEGKR